MASNNENFYKRLQTLSGINKVNESKNETNTETLVDYERANNGTAYGVVKENHHYFIKKALVREGDVKVTDFIYIDGVENKGKYQYNSLAEAEKQRNFYLKGINEAFDQGGVYFVNESETTEIPSLETNEDFSSLVKRTISEGKKSIVEGREKKFKSTLPDNVDAGVSSKKSLMPEAADVAIKKALGLIKEEAPFTEKPKGEGDEVTADSKIKDGDKVSEKSGKEAPQAPINDSNAKAKAEKATGKSKKDANKKPEASDSLAVNQEDQVLKEEVSPLVTDDSEINDADNVADKVNQKHEAPQAPINDSNAKAEADKAMGTSASEDSAMPNQDKEEQKESDPFDDKEDKGDEKGDIVTEDADKGQPFDDKAKVQGGGDEVTADSDEKDADRVDDETKVEKADAKYHNHNQPDEGHKEEKGEELKPVVSKKDIVAEGDTLVDADSDINVDSKDNIEFKKEKNEKGTSYSEDENSIAEGVNEAGEEELDAAADALNDLEVATDAEAAEDVPAEGGEDVVDGEIPDGEGGEDVPAEGGEDTGDLAIKEIEKLVGKFTQKVRNTEIEPSTAEGLLKSVVSSFEDKLPEMELEDRKEVADKILKADNKKLDDSGEEVASDAEVEVDAEVPTEGGEEVASDAEIGGGEFNAIEKPEVEEDAPMTVNGEDVVDGEIPDGEGGTFEAYMESRGYSKDNLDECSASEMGSIVSGYITDKDGDLSEAEIKDIASYMDDNVATELEEYGHGDFAKKAKPFMKEDGISFGMVEPTMSPIEMKEDEVEDEIENELDADDAPETTVVAVGEPEEEAEEEAEEAEEAEEEAEGAEADDDPEMGFAPMADVLGGGRVKPDGAPTKSVEVDLNAGTLKMAVAENENVRKYVRNRLEELAGKKKPTINESSKSENLKKLDKLIEQQWKMFGDEVKKNSKRN